MLRTTRNFMIIAMLAVIGVIAGSTAYAQQNCSCIIVDGCKVVTFYDSLNNPITTETICPSTGTGDFDCAKEIPPTGPLNLSLPPVGINARGNSPTFGPIVTRIDPTRRSTNATIVSNTKERFPATVQFSFYAISTVGGVEYRSRTELLFRNNNVRSFRPFQQEKFCLQRDVEFVAASGARFVLRAGSTCVTLN